MLRALALVPLLTAGLALAQEGAPPPPPPSGEQALDPKELEKLAAELAKAAQQEQEEFAKQVGLKDGPFEGNLLYASIQVPEKFVFTDGAGAKKWAQLTTNPISGREIGLMGPTDGEWLVLFEFDDIGYVKDDDKDDLDADELLASFKQGNESFNQERVAAGLPPMNILGWEQKPAYNEQSHSLEWCIRAESGGRPNLNFNTRILGRRGVVSVTLIFGGDLQLATVLPEFRKLLATFKFKEGETYAEYKEGDKLAEYGLGALVLGGGAAVAAKTGLLSKLGVLIAKGGKAIVVGIVAVVGVIGSLFKKLLGRKE